LNLLYSDTYLCPGIIGNPEYGGSGQVFYVEILSVQGTRGWEKFCIDVGKERMAGRRGRDIFIVGFTNDSCSYIPTSPAYGVYISQLIRCSKACVSYHEFLASMLLPIGKLMNQ
jgi:hypothetical protein